MSSIPYKPKKSHEKDIGPSYYHPNTKIDTKGTLSTSNKGSSAFSSTVDRFPFIHDKWGYPEPGLYDANDAFKSNT